MTELEQINNTLEDRHKDWHKIMPDKSNYINMHQYFRIQDVIALFAAIILREAGDNVMNHSLSTIILQEPDNTKCTRFTKWLKKKLFGPNQDEVIRIIFDNNWCLDISLPITDFVFVYTMLRPQLQSLIEKSKETNND